MEKKRNILDITKDNDKTFLSDGMETSDIKKTVKNIREYIEKGGSISIEDRINQLKIDNSVFIERYPMLFDMCVRQDFNYDHLQYFLNMRDKIITNKVSTEDASKIVGKDWFDKFVDTSKLPKK